MVHGDDNGLVLPPKVAPIQVIIVPIQMSKEGVLKKCREIYEVLKKNNIRVKLDDTDKTPGWKFSNYEVKGVPLRIELGPRDIENNSLTLVKRNDYTKRSISLDSYLEEVKSTLEEIQNELYKKAYEHLQNNIHEAKTYDEFKDYISKGGYVKICWCGNRSCEDKIKEDTNATSRCMPFDEKEFSDTCPVCGKKAKHVIYFAKSY